VTVISTVAALPGGLVAVQLVVEVQLTAVPAAVPKSTVVAAAVVENPVPLMVTLVPPERGPEVGLMAVTVGTAEKEEYVNLSAALVAEVTPPTATVTSTVPVPAGLVTVQLVAVQLVTVARQCRTRRCRPRPWSRTLSR
jgi:hypothetical protein